MKTNIKYVSFLIITSTILCSGLTYAENKDAASGWEAELRQIEGNIKNQLDELAEKNVCLENERELSQNQISQLQSDKTQLLDQHSLLKQEKDQLTLKLSQLNDRYYNTKKELANALLEKDILIKGLRHNIKSLKQETASLKNERKELNDKLLQTAAAGEAKIKELKDKVSSLKMRKEEYSKRLKEDYSKQLKEAEEKNARSLEAIKSLTKQLDLAKTSSNGRQDILAEKEKQAQNLKQQITRLSDKIASLNKREYSTKKRYAKVIAQKDPLISRLKKEKKEWIAKSGELEEKLTGLDKEYIASKEMNNAFENTINEYKKSSEQLTVQISDVKGRNKELEDKVSEKIETNEQLQDKVAKFQSRIDELSSDNTKLTKKLAECDVVYGRKQNIGKDFDTKDEIYHGLGYLYLLVDDADKAIKFYNKSLDANSENKDIYYNLGYLYAQKGKYRQAVSSYKKALTGGAADKDIYYNLAVIYSNYLKNDQTADAYFDKFMKY